VNTFRRDITLIIAKDWVTAIIAIVGIYISAYLISDYYWKAQKNYEWARTDREKKFELWSNVSELLAALMLTMNRQADLDEQLKDLTLGSSTQLQKERIKEIVHRIEDEATKRKELAGQIAGKIRLGKVYFGSTVSERIDSWRIVFNALPSKEIIRLKPESTFVQETLGLLKLMEDDIRNEMKRETKL
jgi:hypothetical protein